MKNSMECPQKTKNTVQQSLFWVILKGNETSVLKRYLHFHVFCRSVITKLQKQQCLSFHQWINGQRNCETYSIKLWYINYKNNGILSALKKRRFCHLQQHRGHYAEWKKPDKERKRILHDLTYMWNLKKSNRQKQRAEQWLPGAGTW